MDIEEAKDWLASVDVHSEAEASYKELILSTLETALKELENLKIAYKLMENEALRDGGKKIKKLETELKEVKDNEYEANNIISDLLDVIKKKDKIIDGMAEEISNSILNTCPYADYNKNLNCERRCSDDDNLFVKCWKKYFEAKAENEIQEEK